ncbi:hypothetical protein HKCCE2091_17225, partial [Rhodobacterales bacterium HKCCE2091]|nr:hypothetical protein [Rhodobacterales bacterium HKCCE2091]
GEAALAACIAAAGPPSAAVPVSEAAQAEVIAALQAVAGECELAVERLGDGDGTALFHLGTLAQTSGDQRGATAFYERAANAGLTAAHTRLGDRYMFPPRPARRDVGAAVEQYTIAAEAGDPPALTTMAFLHLLGEGVPRDPARALALMGQAADAGYHFAQFRLGQIYLAGQGIPEAEQAALGIPDFDRAADLLAAASDNGNTEATLRLAELYSGDVPGVPQDDAARFRWTRAAAEMGLPDAIARLGFLYERGIGTAPDPQAAARAYVQALEAGAEPGDLRGTIGGVAVPWDEATAVAFQSILIERGVYDGPLDGLIGEGTIRGALALRRQ